MNRTTASALAALALLLPSASVLAQESRDNARDSVEMSLGNDLYAAGDTVDIMRNLPGDLNAAGNRVIIRGTVNGDVQAAGSNVTIDSTVHDDIRIAAGDVSINGTVDGDVIVFAGNVYISNGATIVGNLIVLSGDVTIDGAVRGTVKINGKTVKINGSISDEMTIDAHTVTIAGSIGSGSTVKSTDIELLPAARISGTMRYWQKQGEEDFGGTHSGTLIFDPELQPADASGEEHAGALALIIGAVSLITLLYAALTIGIFMLVTRTFFIDAAKRLKTEPGWSFLWGLLYFIVAPVCALLLMITVIGLPLGAVLLAFWMMSVFFSYVIASIVLARWFELRSGKKKKWHPAALYFVALGIYVLMQLIEIIPVAGWIADFVLVMMTYGSVLVIKKERFMKVR